MAKAPKAASKTSVPAGYGSDATTTAPAAQAQAEAAPLRPAVINAPIPTDKELIAKTDAANKIKDDEAKAEAKRLKEEAKAAKTAAADKVKAEKAAARAESKAARETRLGALAADGKNYTGSMLALADRVKTGHYVVGATGQLRSNDELALALDGISPTDVVRIGLDMLKIEENPYTKLNIGQQSMNLRNRMRGAIKKAVFTIADINEYVKRNEIAVVLAVPFEVKEAAKAQKKADADAAKQAKVDAAAIAAKAKVDAAAIANGDSPVDAPKAE